MTKKTLTTLAAAFAALSEEGAALESVADSVLAIVKSDGLKDVKAFSAAVREAYKANGWNAKQGAPVLGAAKLERVPPTVKQYVSQIRGAFRLGLNVGHFKNFHALRTALKAARVASRPVPKVDPRLGGLRLTGPAGLTGAPLHDLVVVYEALPKGQQSQMVGAVNRLVQQFRPAVPQLLQMAA